MKRIGAVIAALGLVLGALVDIAPAASAAVPTHTSLGVCRCEPNHSDVFLDAGAQHWAPRRHEWVGSNGAYVVIQVWRIGGWRYLGAVTTGPTNNFHWATGFIDIHRKRRHTYRAVSPPTSTRAGSHSRPKTI